MATQAEWRRWAILLTLFRRAESMRTKDLLFEIEWDGWDVLPTHGRWDSVHAACVRLIQNEAGIGFDSRKVRRIDTRPARWELTSLGRQFVSDFLVDNPNITPEKSREERD
jgi:hypothetical protein